MIFRISLVLSIFVVWLCSAGTNDTVLSPFIEKSASLARISATISIHNGIFAKNSTVQEVVAEFLEISPTVAKELLEHDYHSLSSSLKKFHNTLNKIFPEMKNEDELIETLNFLMDMKVNKEYLMPGKIGDQTERFPKTTEIIKDATRMRDISLDDRHMKVIARVFREIQQHDWHAKTTERKKTRLLGLKRVLFLTEEHLSLLIDYKTVLKEYLNLESLTKDLQSIVHAAEIAEKYSETIEKLDPRRKDLIAASIDRYTVEEVIKEIQKSSETIQNLVSTSIVLNSTVIKYEEKVLTRGLLSHKDLMLFGKDFENLWFQENVLSNLDPKNLKNGLENLKPFVDALENLISIKKAFMGNIKEKKTTLDLVQKIGDFHKLGSQVLIGSNIKSMYEEISKCIEPLRPIQNPPDPEMFQRIVDFSADVVRTVKIFSEFMEYLNKNDLENIATSCHDIMDTIGSITETSNDSTVIDTWNAVRKYEKDRSLADKFHTIVEVLKEAPHDFFLKDQDIDYTVLQRISTAFEGTNVESVLNCIQTQTVDSLVETLRFVNKSRVLKNQETNFQTASNFISSISTIQSKYKEIKILVKICRLTTESYSMMYSGDLQKLQNTSITIGKCVSSLRALDNILKGEKSIISVANAEIPNLDSSFDDSYQKMLATILNTVKNLSKAVESKSQESMKDLENVFATLSEHKASKLNIPTKFLMKIGLNLSNNSNPEFGQDFEIVSHMDMNFAKHSMAFGSMKGSFELTKESLAEFLKNRTDIVKPVKGHFIFFSDISIKDIVGIILILAVAVWMIATSAFYDRE